MFRSILILVGLTILSLSVMAQDPRISQFSQMPLLLNPANTGNFNGFVRVGGFYNEMKDDSLKNSCTNFSADFNLGENAGWALGINGMHSGSSKFAMSGDYLALSLVKAIRFNESTDHLLRVGIQASYNSGSLQKNKGGYSPYLDVRAFNLNKNLSDIDSGDLFKKNYLNVNAGAVYRYSGQLFDFETGIGVYNITHPEDDILVPGGIKKRFRLTLNSSFRFNINDMSSVQLQQVSWQEGLYVRVAPGSKSDSLQFHETLYGVSWERISSRPQYSVGLFLRSAKSMFAVVGCSIIPEVTAKLSYEFPINKQYYGVSQFGVSLVYQDINFD